MTTRLSKEGILYKKDYSIKLEFQFEHLHGEKVFKFEILKLKSWEGIKRTYGKSEDKSHFMKEQEFIDYLYNEGYLDNKEL